MYAKTAVIFRTWNATDIKVVPIAHNTTSIECANETYEFDGYEQVILPHLQVLHVSIAGLDIHVTFSQ